eukprot:1033299-Alexandrium_andersonii.AAC.1
MRSPDPLVGVNCFAPNSPLEVAAPARPTGQTALSMAQNLHRSEPPHNANPGAGGAARSAAPPAPTSDKQGLRSLH